MKEFPLAAASLAGIALPALAGAVSGHTGAGMAAALGGLLLNMTDEAPFKDELCGFILSLTAGCTAILTGTLLKNAGVPYLIPLLAFPAALLGGLSRTMVRITTQFILFTIIAAGSEGQGSLLLAPLFLTGGVISFITHMALRKKQEYPPKPKYTSAQYINRWKRTLKTIDGWRYTLILTLCLALASAYDAAFPHHHGYWAALTAVIVVRRDHGMMRVRIAERALGTAAGILLTVTFIWLQVPWQMPALALLAFLRPLWYLSRYTLYAAVMTPLVILLLDFGKAAEWGIINDRLLATLAGCATAYAAAYFTSPKVS